MTRFTLSFAGLLFALSLYADEWPMVGGDSGRTHFTTGTIDLPLHKSWEFRPARPPQPAWPTSDRQPFDRAFHVVSGNGMVFFGSSADCRVYALDAKTGETRWTYVTGGPIRFAPVFNDGRVFAVSDDGFLYCLNAKSGEMQWKHRGGPNEKMILGNDRMISAWPARGGPVVVGKTVYYGAGIWPSDGIFMYALDIATGEERWKNDKSGGIYMGQPHGGAYANSGVSAQGYLLATDEKLLIPTGRAVPAVFDRKDGKFAYFHLQQNGHRGGTSAMAMNDHFINAGAAFHMANGALAERLPAGPVAKYHNGTLVSTPKHLIAYEWGEFEKRDRKGNLVKTKGMKKRWTMDDVPGGVSLVVANNIALVGAADRLTAVDLVEQTVVWSTPLAAKPYGLAVAGGRVFASLENGEIQCYMNESPAKKPVVHSFAKDNLYQNKNAERAARRIIEKTGITEGYCLDIGCGDGALAHALATQTKLHIIAVDSDPQMVKQAREKLIAAGLYGVRVTVHHADLTKTPYPNHFANLIVSGRSVMGQSTDKFAKEIERLQRPFGGTAIFGEPGQMTANVRGPLKGAGQWTHQYANPANTCCTTDEIVKGPLKMLWFRDSDFPMPQRHGRGPAPLVYQGKLYVEGMHGLRAVDAYNGRTLWEYPLKNILKAYDADHLMGTAGTNSNFCIAKTGLYVRVDDRCLRLDLDTGEKLAEFKAPTPPLQKDGEKPGRIIWGYIACENGTLYGSVVHDDHIVKHSWRRADMSELFTESRFFFALDAVTGKVKWTFEPKHAIRHNAIAIGNGRVFLIDRPLAKKDRLRMAAAEPQPAGELFALDADSGRVLWQSKDDVDGTTLTLSVPHDVLVMSYQPTRFRLPSEVGKKMTAFRGLDGKRMWKNDANYVTRPIINGRTIYAQGGAWDLLDGAGQTFKLKRSYGCGQIAGSKYLMLFRSATLGYFDVFSGKTIDYGGIRPGCWINSIPAAGIVLVPDASSGCRCSYLNQAWIALEGK